MYFKIIKVSLASIGLLCLAGCAPKVAYVPDSTLTPENSGIITIYRTRTAYHSLNPEKPFAYVDEKQIGKLGVGAVIIVKVSPGSHRFSRREPIFFQTG